MVQQFADGGAGCLLRHWHLCGVICPKLRKYVRVYIRVCECGDFPAILGSYLPPVSVMRNPCLIIP